MENEQIVLFEMDCRDKRGRLVHVVGVDQANQRVLYRRPDYQFGLCFCRVVILEQNLRRCRNEPDL